MPTERRVPAIMIARTASQIVDIGTPPENAGLSTLSVTWPKTIVRPIDATA